MLKNIIVLGFSCIALIYTPLVTAKDAKRYDDSVMWKNVVKINFKNVK